MNRILFCCNKTDVCSSDGPHVCVCVHARVHTIILQAVQCCSHTDYSQDEATCIGIRKRQQFSRYMQSTCPLIAIIQLWKFLCVFFFNSSHRCVRKHVAYASIFATPVVRIDVSSFIWMFCLNLSEHRYYTLVYPLGRRQAQLIIIQIVCTRKWNKSEKSKYACVHWTLYLRSIWTNEHVLYENWTKYNNNKLIAKWYASCDCAYNTRHCELWTICMHCEIVCLPVRYVHCSETVWQSSEWAPLIAKRLGKSDDLGKCRKACGCVLRPHKKTQIRRHFYLLHEVIYGSVCNRSVDCEYAKMNIFFPF